MRKQMRKLLFILLLVPAVAFGAGKPCFVKLATPYPTPIWVNANSIMVARADKLIQVSENESWPGAVFVTNVPGQTPQVAYTKTYEQAKRIVDQFIADSAKCRNR